MPPLQAVSIETTDGTANPHPVDTSAIEAGNIDLVSGFMMEVADAGVADRCAYQIDVATQLINILPPAKVGGLDVWLARRYEHSIQKGILARYFSLDETIPAAQTVLFPYALGDDPDFVSVVPYGNVPSQDWAVTVIADNGISIKNWDAVNDLHVTILVEVVHSLFRSLTEGPYDVAIAGLGNVVQLHGLVASNGQPLTPTMVTGFPYSAGGIVQPVGNALMPIVPDNTNLTFAGGDATAAQILRCYVQLPHSIQR